MFPLPRDDFGSQDTEAAQAERAAQEPASPLEALGAMAGQTTGDVLRFAKHKLQPEPFFQGDLKSPKELNEQYGLKGANAFTNWTNSETAAEMVAAMKRRQQADEVLTRFSNSHSWLTRNAVGMIGSVLDPVEASAMLVPGVGEERIAYKLAEMGFGKQAAIIAGKMGAGATGAMAGTAALEPLRAIMSDDELREWSLRDAMTNVFYAAPVGALLHAGISPAVSAGLAKATGRDIAPYFHDYYHRPQLAPGMPEPRDLTQEGLRAAVIRGVAEGSFDPDRAPSIGNTSFGHIQELLNMTAAERHRQQTVNTAQILSGREVDNTALFPDHSEQARRIAPEAHEEWDRLQAEHDALAAEHVWGARPTPEQLNDPAWKLEQELREQVRDILPVSWDLRVAAEGLPEHGPGAMFSLPSTPDAPQGFRGVHSTSADIEKIEKEKFGSREDYGYWGSGFYMFPYDVAKAGKGTFYGPLKEGAKNYLITVDSKKPFYIDSASGSANWRDLHDHGWKHDMAPVKLWEDRNVVDEAKKRVPDNIKKALRDAEDEVSDKRNILLGMEDDDGELLPGITESEFKKASKELQDARERAKSARMVAAPEAQLSKEFTDAVLKAGYDSVIITKGDKPYEMVGIKPGTLKSTFGRDVMYSFGGEQAAAPPHGRSLAEQMEQRGESRERISKTSVVAQGMADPARRTAWISAMAVDPKLVAREESGHAIRASGLFKPEEWSILRDAAINRGWIFDMPKEVRDRYEQAYADRGPEVARDAMAEEAIMHRFAKGPDAWGEPGGPIARLMQRIRELLERIGNWMTSRGFQSVDDVFRAMEDGTISGRDTMAPHAARRAGEIEARMKELEPQIISAYNEAKANYQPDIPTIADAQKSLWLEGFAPAIERSVLQQALQQLYGPREEIKFTPAKPGEVPVELQLMEQQYQKMIAEGYRPLTDEIAEFANTERGIQQALMTEAGYAQAGECLSMVKV